MKSILIIIICFAVTKGAYAQVSDSIAKAYSNYICQCLDTVNLDQPEAALLKQVTLCKTLSVTHLLNERLITPGLLTDEKQLADLEKKGRNHLVLHCKKIELLAKSISKEPVFDETNKDELFTPVAFFETYDLKKGETNDRLHVYNNTSHSKETPKYHRVVDIRWTFKSEADAMKWHQMNLRKNAEGGIPVDDNIIIPGAAGLKVFRESAGAAEMMKAMGVGQHHHYFLFIYKNIACKIFVATDEKTNSVEVMPFAIAAVTQLKSVLK